MEAKVVKLHLHAPRNLKNVIIAESVEKQNLIFFYARDGGICTSMGIFLREFQFQLDWIDRSK